MPPFLSDDDQERVRDAVAAAEERSSGEIVPYVVSRSGSYEIAIWRGAVTGLGLVMVVALISLQAYGGWNLGWAYTAWGMAILITCGGAIGAGIPWLSRSARRALAGRARMNERVHLRAEAAFLEEGVFETRDRTGVLLFVSLFEHRIEVVADSGIHTVVPEEKWVEVVDVMRRQIIQGRLADGLIAGIQACGVLLEESNLSRPEDPRDEIPGDVRLRAR